MRNTFAHCVLLLCATALSAGCSPSNRSEQAAAEKAAEKAPGNTAEKAAENPEIGSWASEKKMSGGAVPEQKSALPDAFAASPPSFAPLDAPIVPAATETEPPVPLTGEPPLGSLPVGHAVEEPTADKRDHLLPEPPVASGELGEPPAEGTLPYSFSDNPLRADGSRLSASDGTRRSPMPASEFLDSSPPPSSVSEPAEPGDLPSNALSDTPSRAAVPPSTSLTKLDHDVPDSIAVPSANPKVAGKKADETYDPIKENGPIFVGWTKPKLAVVVTGREDGYIEPCGCAGLDKMKGGLSRRHTMIETLREKGWPVVAVDVGGFTKGYGRQTEIKFQSTIEAMRRIDYAAIGFGANDLRLPAGELVSVAADPSPFVSANVGLFGFDANLTSRVKIVDVGGLKVGVTAVLGKTYQGDVNNQEIEMVSPEEALARVLPELKKKCNLLILLAHATKDEAIELGAKFPEFQIVVTAGGPAEPPSEPLRIPVDDPRSLLIEVGEKGMNAVVLGFYDDPRQPVRYQRVPLDSRFKASRDMYRIMVAYQEQLKRQGLAGLNIRPVPHPQSDINGEYVGSEACKSCHEESYRVWRNSGHAKGWKTLVDLDPPRNFDPECISCHVIGWHPTKYFPYESGFLSEEKTPHLVNVGCETCHGPGGAHCRAEEGSDFELQEKLYEAIRVTKEEAQTNSAKMCQNCHDLDNSPDFDFETYWPEVEHYEDE